MNYFKSQLIKILLNSDFIEKIAIRIVLKKKLLPFILVNTPSNLIRKIFNLPRDRYESQLNQDFFALLINNFSTGFFLEIGANDGFTLSNTTYLEANFNWSGILIEANPKYLRSLKSRKSIIVNKAITDSIGKVRFVDAGLYGGILNSIDRTHIKRTHASKVINVDGSTLKKILNDNLAPKVINFVSVDVEGGEYQILRQICELKEYIFICGCIEHNYRKNDISKFKSLLKKNGYCIFWEGQTGHDLFFVNKNYLYYEK